MTRSQKSKFWEYWGPVECLTLDEDWSCVDKPKIHRSGPGSEPSRRHVIIRSVDRYRFFFKDQTTGSCMDTITSST